MLVWSLCRSRSRKLAICRNRSGSRAEKCKNNSAKSEYYWDKKKKLSKVYQSKKEQTVDLHSSIPVQICQFRSTLRRTRNPRSATDRSTTSWLLGYQTTDVLVRELQLCLLELCCCKCPSLDCIEAQFLCIRSDPSFPLLLH